MTTKSKTAKTSVRKAVKAARKVPVKKSAIAKVIERVADGQMAASLRLPLAPQLDIYMSVKLLPVNELFRR